MSSEAIERSAADRIALAFDLDEGAVQAPSDILAEIRRRLIERIVELLTRNPERLMAILYRIDVKESAVNEIMSKSFPTEVPIHLADLIIERQLAKARSRAEHRDSSTT